MIKKVAASFFIGMVCNAVHAGTVERYESVASVTPEFVYKDATASHPLVVDAVSENGQCNFKLSLIGIQAGVIKQSSLTGRVESGQCNGKQIKEGLVRASITPVGKKVVLNRKLDVIVLDGLSAALSKAGVNPTSEHVAVYQAAQRLALDKASERVTEQHR